MKNESKKFGAQGGRARAANMTKAERSEAAKNAALARWGADLPIAQYSGILKIGDMEIPCAVLEDGTRVLTQWGFYRALGRSGRPAAGRGSDVEKMAPFLDLDNLKPFVDAELANSTKPIVFRGLRGGKAYGYRADLLPKVCEVYLRARDEGKLLVSQEKFAKACDIIVRGLAHVGIVALVDEATGYQDVRRKDALAEILDAFIAKELRPWVRRFPFEFYQEIFRLKDWDTSDLTPNSPKPAEVGRITVDVIYRRIGPSGILKTLKKLTPRNEKGYLKNKLHSWLTPDIGDPKLEVLVAKVITTMRLSKDWPHFMQNLELAGIKRYTDNLELPLYESRATSALPASTAAPSDVEEDHAEG